MSNEIIKTNVENVHVDSWTDDVHKIWRKQYVRATKTVKLFKNVKVGIQRLLKLD